LIGHDYYPESDPSLAPKRQFALSIGRIVGEMVNEDTHRVEVRMKNLLEHADEVCPLLSDHEKSQIADVIADTDLKLFALDPKFPWPLHEKWEKLCH
jgi:hypothetical protein